jgi:NADP-dependent 3-hydroxy acid dehydrogenase YdfG
MDKVLKVAITGHTKGIGASIYNKFKTNGHLTSGYSRTTGYDITDSSVQDSILKQCEDFDIFVNNAYAPKAQTALLEKFINQWKNTNKLIINLSSKLVFYPGKTNDFFDMYMNDKKEQNNICIKRVYSDQPRVLNIMPGLVDTEMSNIFTSPKMPCDNVASYIYDIVKYKDVISTQQIIIDVPGLDWSAVGVQL